MEYKDYYKILGLTRDAGQDEVKRSYRKLARKFHPDVSKEPNAEERFKEVNEAYEVLKDPEKRKAYDQLGSNWKAGQEFRPPPGWEGSFEFGGGGFTGAEGGSFSDFFESLFGGRSPFGFSGTRSTRGRSGLRMRGEDQHAKLLLSLEEAYAGVTRSIQLQVPEIDQDGRVTAKLRRLQVKVPAGVTQGQQIRLAGQGAPGVGGAPAGDLYLEMDLEPHRLFTAEGRDIYLTLPISPWEAALGVKVTVPTLGGNVELRIPPDSQSGRKLRLHGRGLPGHAHGDQYVLLQIVTPPADSDEVRELYRRLARATDFNPRARLGS